MDEPSLLRVLVGASRLPRGLDQPTLIVEAENERLKALELQLRRVESPFPVLLRQGVPGARDQAELTWFCYNDSRLNGTVPPERLRLEYPNVQLDAQVTLQSKTLALILSEWPAANDGDQSIEITISQGDPVELLSGAAEWLRRITRIKLQSPHARTLWLEPCDAWLQKQGFRLEPQEPLCWRLDPLAAQLIRQQADIDAMCQQHQQEIQLHVNREQDLLAALRHVFPYPAYRDKRPDMASAKDHDIVNHFVAHGIKEGVNLQFSPLYEELKQLRADRAGEAGRLHLLETKTRQTAQHLELLKDLFARLMVNP